MSAQQGFDDGVEAVDLGDLEDLVDLVKCRDSGRSIIAPRGAASI